jgi:hypothetical protein
MAFIADPRQRARGHHGGPVTGPWWLRGHGVVVDHLRHDEILEQVQPGVPAGPPHSSSVAQRQLLVGRNVLGVRPWPSR